MGILNTYLVPVSGYLQVEAYGKADARQAAEDKLAKIDHRLELVTGEPLATTNYR